jgi:hypothetical protein
MVLKRWENTSIASIAVCRTGVQYRRPVGTVKLMLRCAFFVA